MSTPASITLPAVGASVWASGSHVWNGHTGSFTAKARNKRAKTAPIGMTVLAPTILSGMTVMSKVPVEKKRARIPTSISAPPSIVKIKNFMAEYSLRPLPQMAMRKNIGTSSSSQNRKNIKKSRAVKTPNAAVINTSNHTKYSRTRCWIPHDAKTATIPSRPVRSTSGALRPSTARKYSTLNDSSGIQPSKRSTSWKRLAPFPISY